jgi:hypothetical protein
MVKKITVKKLQDWARSGSQVAFAQKRNARRYQSILRRRGFYTGTMRSWGPAVDTTKNRNVKSYYVLSEKKRRGR